MNGSARLYNLLASLIMGLTTLVCLGMTMIFVNPSVFFNPFKPVNPDDGHALMATAAPAPTDLPANTLRAPAVATKTSTPLPSATMAGSATAFPSPVGPTETTTPTKIPTQTPTLRPPPPSATRRCYPGGATDLPPPTAYP